MRIFNWVHRKFRPNEHDYDYGVKDPSGEIPLDERTKRIRIPQEDKVKENSRKDKNYCNVNEDTVALLGPRDTTVTELFSKWQNGLLAIGTFGIDQHDQGYDYGYESQDVEDILFKETDDEDELIDPIEVDVFEGKLEEVFGLKNEDYYQVNDFKPQKWQNKELDTKPKSYIKENSNSNFTNESSEPAKKTNTKNNGNKIYPLQEFFEVPLLAGTLAKKEHRTTLADLFSRSKNYTSSNMFNDAPKREFECELEEKLKKKDESLRKSGRSFVKKVFNWKKGGDLHRPKQWMKKMLNKKIYPEVVSELHANEVIGQVDISKTYVSKLKETNSGSRRMDENGYLTNGSSDFSSLSRDSSRGSQECWIKTDSEYVVLEL
ncbi:protein LAZY 1 isoform X2 [Cryptomeria japonica]|uniref:protein LAZY 1 isoform X2 n=1 Tax=Cryptomeria japonica TaxID=3369 RepID=UPI0027DA816F|nr:protein LAZY 1 isoform X2 [Cryptomeria japonica]